MMSETHEPVFGAEADRVRDVLREPSDLAVAVHVARKTLAAYGDSSIFGELGYAQAHGALSESLRILLRALGVEVHAERGETGEGAHRAGTRRRPPSRSRRRVHRRPAPRSRRPGPNAILRALGNLGIAPLNKAIKAGWMPRWVQRTPRLGNGYHVSGRPSWFPARTSAPR